MKEFSSLYSSTGGHEWKKALLPWWSMERDYGFTLMEVLVAIIILSISLATIMQLYSGGLKLSLESDYYTRAVFHAREKMEEFLCADTLKEGNFQGDFGDGFTWNCDVSLVQPPEDEEDIEFPFGVFEINLHIVWHRGSQEKTLDLTTIKLAKKEKND